MDANDIVKALEGILGIGDTLDSNNAGALAITNGKYTTREIIKMELGMFLLYVGDGGNEFTEGQAALINLLLSDQFGGELPAWRMKSVAENINTPDPDSNASFTAFRIGDKALSEQNGSSTTQLSDLLINIYESFGSLMVALNENALSKLRCDNFVNRLKNRQLFDDVEDEAEVSKPAKSAVSMSNVTASSKKANKTKKETGTKSKAAQKAAGGKQDYDEMISFMLPSGYQMDRETNDDGVEKVYIHYGPGTDDNGNQTWEFSPEISPIEIVDSDDDMNTVSRRWAPSHARKNK